MKIRNALASDVRNVKILIEELEDIQMESAEFESIFLEYIEQIGRASCRERVSSPV